MKYSYIKDVKIIKTIILLHKGGANLVNALPEFLQQKVILFSYTLCQHSLCNNILI